MVSEYETSTANIFEILIIEECFLAYFLISSSQQQQDKIIHLFVLNNSDWEDFQNLPMVFEHNNNNLNIYPG